MEIKLQKPSSRSKQYRLLIPAEYFDSIGFAENDILDVDIIPIFNTNYTADTIKDDSTYKSILQDILKLRKRKNNTKNQDEINRIYHNIRNHQIELSRLQTMTVDEYNLEDNGITRHG